MSDESIDERFTSRRLAEAAGAAAKVQGHLEQDSVDACGYCGQFFGPETVAVERHIYGRKLRFCDEECYTEFVDKTNFKDQDLDGGPRQDVRVGMQEGR